jgi:parallel beta-helix repeat protein
MFRCLLAVLTAAGSPAAASARELTFYVATNGNNNWSGTRAAPAADKKDGPLATLPAAIDAARRVRGLPGQPQNVVTVVLRGGTYPLTEPVVLKPEDSGAGADQPFTIAAYRNEQPILSGGRRIGNWKPAAAKPGFWQAEVPDVRDGKWYFRQLFVAGQRRQRARTPNTGYFNIQGAFLQNKPVQFKFEPGSISKEWADLGDVEVISLNKWIDIRQPIREIDPAAQTIILAGEIHSQTTENNARYYIENAPDALDQPGEWRLDRKSGLVTYWAPAGEDLTKAQVVAPFVNSELLRFEGDFSAKRPVHNIVVRGLTFAYTDWVLPKDGYADSQAAVQIRGDVLAEGAVDCTIQDCVFTHLGGYALELGRGCQRFNVERNDFSDIGAGGIRLGETVKRENPFEANHSQVITDNHLHQLGRVYAPAVGILVLQSGQNRIAHNHVHDLAYTAISVGWNWGYQETPCRENVIEFNHLHDVGQGVLSDLGGVYTLGIQKGTVIRNNLIHDVNSYAYGGWGLYTDEGSSEIVLENNVVYRCKSAGFHQHYGRENIIRNNIFAFGKEFQLMRTREEAHLSFIFTNNIVCFDSGQLLGSNWKNDRFVMDNNIYFDARPGAAPDSLRFSGVPLNEWRQRGHDLHSQIANPEFVEPPKDDFRLKPGSPALKLGFKPIDLRTVGVRKR